MFFQNFGLDEETTELLVQIGILLPSMCMTLYTEKTFLKEVLDDGSDKGNIRKSKGIYNHLNSSMPRTWLTFIKLLLLLVTMLDVFHG